MGKTGSWTLSDDAVRFLKWLSDGETFVEFHGDLLDELDSQGMIIRSSAELRTSTVSLTERGWTAVKKIIEVEREG